MRLATKLRHLRDSLSKIRVYASTSTLLTGLNYHSASISCFNVLFLLTFFLGGNHYVDYLVAWLFTLQLIYKLYYFINSLILLSLAIKNLGFFTFLAVF